MNINWKWKTAVIVFMLYHGIARYYDFKQAVGLSTNNCGCELK